MSEIIHSHNAHRTMWKALSSKLYRHAYVLAHIGDFLAMQVHAMRLHRGWTQKQLAEESGQTQPQISKFENSCENINLGTLHKLAEAFDVAVVVKFVPFSEFGRETMSAQADARTPSYEEESPEAISFPKVTLSHPQKLRALGERNGGSAQNEKTAYYRIADVAGTKAVVAKT